MTEVRGRFAPSPSGRMHLGNVLSCLLAWLCARSQGGQLLLRIEDLDPQRCRAEYARLVEEDLNWLGLTYDEGGAGGGPYGPYFQSRRQEHYRAALQTLREMGLTYPCFCTRAELHAAGAPHAGETPVYSGRCRNLSPEEVQERWAHRVPALRLRVPDRTVEFVDGNYGPYRENLALDCGDFILRRSDGVCSYQLAVVVDDACMDVTQVVRGRDLLSSTPRQLHLFQLLGVPAPQYFHIPLLLAPDGRRLSKRERDLDLGVLRQSHTPEALLGKLAFLCGFLPRPEPLTARELLSVFTPELIPKQDLYLPEGLF